MTRIPVLAALLILSLAPGTAWASSIQIQNQAFSGTTDPIGVAPFDPSLGTLDQVLVSINGVLSVNGFAPQLAMGTSGAFQPYTYGVRVEQDFSSVASDYFEFGSPAVFLLNGSTAGAGEAFTLTIPFSYSFLFTSTTDLVGFAFPAFSGAAFPPVQINGRRSDFLETLGSPNQILLTHTAIPQIISGLPPSISNVSSAGTMLIEYRYTAPGVTPVPEPATVGLLAAGLAAMAIGRRRRAVGGRAEARPYTSAPTRRTRSAGGLKPAPTRAPRTRVRRRRRGGL